MWKGDVGGVGLACEAPAGSRCHLTPDEEESGKREERGGGLDSGFLGQGKARKPTGAKNTTKHLQASSPRSSWDRISNTHAPALCDVAAQWANGYGACDPPSMGSRDPWAGRSHPATSLRHVAQCVRKVEGT
jgi:hypothetical protein